MVTSIPCNIVASKAVTPMTAANMGMKRRRAIAPLRTRTTLSLINWRPKTWMSTVSTISGRLHAQLPLQFPASTDSMEAQRADVEPGRRRRRDQHEPVTSSAGLDGKCQRDFTVGPESPGKRQPLQVAKLLAAFFRRLVTDFYTMISVTPTSSITTHGAPKSRSAHLALQAGLS